MKLKSVLLAVCFLSLNAMAGGAWCYLDSVYENFHNYVSKDKIDGYVDYAKKEMSMFERIVTNKNEYGLNKNEQAAMEDVLVALKEAAQSKTLQNVHISFHYMGTAYARFLKASKRESGFKLYKGEVTASTFAIYYWVQNKGEKMMNPFTHTVSGTEVTPWP
jgi:ribosomal protein L17